jgi:hypothetical protein
VRLGLSWLYLFTGRTVEQRPGDELRSVGHRDVPSANSERNRGESSLEIAKTELARTVRRVHHDDRGRLVDEPRLRAELGLPVRSQAWLGPVVSNRPRESDHECEAAVRAVLEAPGKKAGPEDDQAEAKRFHDALQLACTSQPRV